MISRKSVMAVCTPLTVVFRSALMSLIITFMFEPAKLQMNCASASGRISRRAERAGLGASARPADMAPSVIGRCYSKARSPAHGDTSADGTARWQGRDRHGGGQWD